ncbi:MAG: tetratricopeptide repeat-containing sensor histidine kinase [Bacteroidales bacterium]|nr:tetratricopeptide repeat-containing sensor histidine kinase [Bacteroidales bacterium]
MKRLLIIGWLMILSWTSSAQDLDSLYQVFENSKGKTAYQAAVAIDNVIGREPNFDLDTDKDEVKLKLLRTMILYFFNTDDFQHVVAYSEIGIEHYQKIGDLFNEAGCYMTLANAYQRLGQFDKAIDCYNHCSDLMDEIGGDMAEVNKRYVMNNIAEIHLAMNEYGVAEDIYHKCIEMLGEVHEADTASNLDLATYDQNLAEVYVIQGRLDEAVSLAEQSLELSKRYQDTPNKIINRMMSLSKAYSKTGRATEGERLLGEALQLAEANNELFLQAVIRLQQGDYATTIAMAEKNHYDGVLQEALEAGYQDLKDRNPKKALEYLERSIVMKDSIFNENQQQLIRDYQVRYAMQEKEHELAMQQAKNRQIRLLAIGLVVLAAVLFALFMIWWRLAQMRKKRNQELTQLNEMKDRLMSIVSHDVKTPVSAICSVLEQLCSYYDGMNDTDRKASLMMLKSTAEALSDRLYNILQWVKSVLEHGEVTPEDFNLAELVDESVKSIGYQASIKSLKVMNEVEPTMVVHSDPSVVSLVLQNLLSNAVKFSYPNGEIHVRVEEDDRVWLVVQDNGKGIAEQKLAKIFRFVSSSTSGTGGETGTGIGLFVSKQLLDKMGGAIRVESVLGEGTTVKFSIQS